MNYSFGTGVGVEGAVQKQMERTRRPRGNGRDVLPIMPISSV